MTFQSCHETQTWGSNDPVSRIKNNLLIFDLRNDYMPSRLKTWKFIIIRRKFTSFRKRCVIFTAGDHLSGVKKGFFLLLKRWKWFFSRLRLWIVVQIIHSKSGSLGNSKIWNLTNNLHCRIVTSVHQNHFCDISRCS